MSRAGWLSLLAALLAGSGAAVSWQRAPAAEAGAGEPVADAALSLDGASLFQAKGCAGCHDGPDSTSYVGGFPDLSEASSWAGDRRPDLTAAEYLAESIREPWAFISPEFSPYQGGSTNAMPALSVSDAEVDAIVEYLLTE